MRIIYEDGSFRNDENEEKLNDSLPQEEFEDISSMSEEYKRNQQEEDNTAKPYRPAASLRPETKKEEEPAKEQPAPEQPVPAVQPVYGQMYPPVQYPQGYPQGGAVYYPQYPQGYVPAYPQGYPVQYPQYPQGYPMQYPAAAQPVTNTANTAGTRVLYQSPDFDKPEKDRQAAQTVPVYGAPVISSITQEDVSFYPAITPGVRGAARATSFEVDDMEMSVYELNAMAHKYHTTSKAVRKPDEGSLDVEEYEEEILFDDDDEQEDILAEEISEEQEKERKEREKAKKKKKAAKAELIRKIVLAISLIAIVVSALMLYNEFRLSKENEQVNEDVSNLIIDIEPLEQNPDSGNTDSGNDNGDGSGDTVEPEPEPELTVEQQWANVKAEFPDVVFPSNIQLKYARLYGTNQDFVGYLSAPGIDMNLPIVQANDDEYYLKKNFYGKNTKYGCPFVTHVNNIPVPGASLDMNTVIFGHHMNDGSVFGALDAYKSIDGFKAAPVISFNTLYQDYEWKVIAAFITNAYETEDNGYVFKYYFTNLSTEDRFAAFLNELSQRSLYDTGVDVMPTDKILTLSTCSHEFEEARFVVVARLVRVGESAEVDTSKATINPSPRYPQAYYDKKKITNPYANAYRWEVG